MLIGVKTKIQSTRVTEAGPAPQFIYFYPEPKHHFYSRLPHLQLPQTLLGVSIFSVSTTSEAR